MVEQFVDESFENREIENVVRVDRNQIGSFGVGQFGLLVEFSCKFGGQCLSVSHRENLDVSEEKRSGFNFFLRNQKCLREFFDIWSPLVAQ
jgi:hypothetical protein